MPPLAHGDQEISNQIHTKRKGFLTIGWTALSMASGGCPAPSNACGRKLRRLAVFVPAGFASRLTRMLDAKKLDREWRTVNYRLRKSSLTFNDRGF
jgi:hypothetical protein